MAKKKQALVQPQSDSEDSEDAQFVVEVIKAAKVEDGEWRYLVKWADYSSDVDTWEPEENLENCARLLRKFWDDVGVDDDDYYEGYVVKARPSWIRKEKKIFQKQNNKNKKKAAESSAEDDEPEASTSRNEGKGRAPVINKKGKGKAVAKQSAGSRKRGKQTKAKHQSDSDDAEESDNVPLSSIRSKGKKRAKALAASSDEADDDDKHLTKSKIKKRKQIVTTPPPEPPTPAENNLPDPHLSDSAGSLFSDKGGSSPEVALKTLPTPASSTIPMKRPSVDDSVAQRPGKRQIMEMPMQITTTAGNATKARLAQRNPQAPAQAAAPAPQKLDLSTLSFRKNSATAAGRSPIVGSPVVPSSAVPPLPRRSTSVSEHGQSPAPGGQGTPTEPQPTMGIGGPQFPPDPSRRLSQQLPRRTLTKQIQPPGPTVAKDPMAEATRFLSDIMPASMASPMQEDVPDMPPPPVPVRSVQAKALPRIQKKWKWTGDLFMDVSRNRAERVCEVLISEATDPLPNGLRFSICLSGENIRLSAFHELSCLHTFLLASTRVQQFAKLGSASDKDADALLQLGIFMQKRSYFCFAHLYMDDSSVGLLIIFPTGHEVANSLLKVPPTLASNTPLQVALVPWELTTREFRAANWKSRSPIVEHQLDPAFAAILEADGRSVATQRRFYQALHILTFPKAIYDFMSQKQSPRPYCIWYAPADTTQSGTIGYETLLLREILSTCTQAKDMGYKADVRVVFVHVGALATLHGLPFLVAWRNKRPELRFLTYGTHPSVPRERWGVREIYLIGGVVTFTPSAIIEGHGMLFRRIKDIAEHPLWDCYVLPSVVAMVAKLTCQGGHPLRVYDEGNFVYEDLLKAIEQGSVALLHAPAILRDAPPKGDPSLLWTRWMLRLPSMNARQILEECLRIAAEQFANTSDAELPVAVEKEIARDLLRMQMQPVMMDNYRRFVVLKGRSDTDFQEDRCPGIEVTTLSKLDFRDDFFTTRTDSAQ